MSEILCGQCQDAGYVLWQDCGQTYSRPCECKKGQNIKLGDKVNRAKKKVRSGEQKVRIDREHRVLLRRAGEGFDDPDDHDDGLPF